MIIKVVNEDGAAFHGGHGQWSLPVQNEDGSWTPGDWMPPIVGGLVPCQNGYHGCEDAQVVDWLGPALFEMEVRGEVIRADDKLVAREARLLRRLNWNERIARLFACDCAERVMPLFEQASPGDQRPRRAIETARRFANGEASREELAAAWDAARDAGWGAAWAAARATAWAAAWDAAWAAERAWQFARLTEYLEGER